LPEEERRRKLTWKDYLAMVIALLQTVLLPLVVLILVLLALLLLLR